MDKLGEYFCPCGCEQSLERLAAKREIYTAKLAAGRARDDLNPLYLNDAQRWDNKYTVLAQLEEERLHDMPRPVVLKPDLDPDSGACPCGCGMKVPEGFPDNYAGWKQLKRMRRKEREEAVNSAPPLSLLK